ncbi:hypothetical protein D0T51_10250 [Parabacteroides sp. 52]|uniref:NVEALA domain-containing protein n=1 Tax=Parabacteroides sp. 52 TaxID=2302940 RepID=UPI0013D8677B|nr:NVEALA domain-containing protein [Parabacteroides sp. 52]MDH6534694.1 hypothetical protein [Parabacteroides sp. PM5-20]NDV56106.1 hypothetical protein [Parabacteroides sp. 52]
MKKRIVFLATGGIILFCTYLSLSNKQENLQELTFHNVEALAQNEGSSNYFCIGSGSLDCNGDKVRTVITNFSLK